MACGIEKLLEDSKLEATGSDSEACGSGARAVDSVSEVFGGVEDATDVCEREVPKPVMAPGGANIAPDVSPLVARLRTNARHVSVKPYRLSVIS